MGPPRFRLRTLLIAVAVVAVILGYWKSRERWAFYRWRAAYHARIEDAYRNAERGDDVYFKLNFEIDGSEPEPPPRDPYDPRSFEKQGRELQAAYHARMRRYWETRW